jgi:GT2 family glycosyltransferase
MSPEAPSRKVTVIIVTYNAVKYLDGLFGSLEKIDRQGLEVEIMVADNASPDGTADRIRRRWPWVRLLANRENLGFAGGNNAGMRLALEKGCDYVYLLNQDTEVEPDFLTRAVRAAEAEAEVGSVQSLLLLHPDQHLINSSGNAIHFLGFGYCLDYRRPVSELDRSGRPEIAYASGAGVLYRAAALREVGLLDEELFLYHEDLDLGWRLRLAGYVNRLAPRSVVYHKYEFSRSIKKYYYMERNRLVVLYKNLRCWTILLLLPWLLLVDLGLLVAACRSGWWTEKLRAWGYFFRPRSWSYILRERRRIQRSRRVSDRAIVRLFTPTIIYQEVTGWFTEQVANPLMTGLWAVLRLFIV